jgi:hypothetical protein
MIVTKDTEEIFRTKTCVGHFENKVLQACISVHLIVFRIRELNVQGSISIQLNFTLHNSLRNTKTTLKSRCVFVCLICARSD